MEEEKMSYYKKQRLPNNSDIYEKGKQYFLEQRKHLKEQTQRFRSSQLVYKI